MQRACRAAARARRSPPVASRRRAPYAPVWRPARLYGASAHAAGDRGVCGDGGPRNAAGSVARAVNGLAAAVLPSLRGAQRLLPAMPAAGAQHHVVVGDVGGEEHRAGGDLLAGATALLLTHSSTPKTAAVHAMLMHMVLYITMLQLHLELLKYASMTKSPAVLVGDVAEAGVIGAFVLTAPRSLWPMSSTAQPRPARGSAVLYYNVSGRAVSFSMRCSFSSWSFSPLVSCQ